MRRINPFFECKEYRIPLKRCPSFIFFVMGIIIIFFDLLTYFVGTKYISDPLLVSLSVMMVTIILFILSYFVNRSFEELLEVNRIKTEFINIVSHQIRTPLSSMRWALDFMKSGKLDSIDKNYGSYIDIMTADVKSIEKLIENFLIVAKIEGGQALFKKEKMLISELVRDVLKEFEPIFEARNVEINFQEEEIPEIISDSQKLRIVIENLIDNAVKYSKEKGRIDISLRRKGKKVYFEVRDYGLGIPRKQQKYIFQKFYRSESAKKAQTSGSGLGLYIAKLIINGLGGKIGFSSQEGKGSTFWFTLPLNKKVNEKELKI